MRIARKIITASATATALIFGSGMGQAASKTPQEKLDETLAGFTAGKPVNCISQYAIDDVEIFDHTALLYKVGSDKYYLNIPVSGASSLDNWDVLVTESYSSQLCNVDTVKLWDPSSQMETGFVGLGKFIPYTKAEEGK